MTDRTCSLEGCNQNLSCRGMCVKHYARWRRHGDAATVRGGPDATGPANHGWAADDDTTYRAVHKRLTRLRGPASGHSCADCGNNADHWSYKGDSPKERVNDGGLAYTPDLEFYEPRCGSCHKRRDAPPGQFCPRGHEFAGPNAVVRKNGTRVCRTCKQVWDHDQYAKRKARQAAVIPCVSSVSGLH